MVPAENSSLFERLAKSRERCLHGAGRSDRKGEYGTATSRPDRARAGRVK
jgi:hypothetical protein